MTGTSFRLRAAVLGSALLAGLAIATPGAAHQATVVVGPEGLMLAEAAQPSADQPAMQVSATTLRTTLNNLLSEHVSLAAAATNAALAGRQAEFEAAAAALDGNSVDLAEAVGLVYGAPAGEAFLPLWRTHIGFVVDYTVGKAGQDAAKVEQARSSLTAYAEDFGAFIHSATPALPAEAVADLVRMHIDGLLAVIDAQAAGDQAAAFTATREAFTHMGMIANPLADAIVAQFPDRFA